MKDANFALAPSTEIIDEMLQAWRWLITEPVKPLAFSAFGDVFYSTASGRFSG